MQKLMVLWAAAFGAVMVCIGASTASAQDAACPAHAHSDDLVVECSSEGIPTCVDQCVCDRGYHPQDRSAPVSADNPCVRNHWRDRDGDGEMEVPEMLCDEELLGTRSSGGRCVCTEENVAAGAIGTVPVFVPDTVRRAHGWSTRGDARLCVFPMTNRPGPDTEWREYIEGWLRQLDMENAIICGSDEGASREERLDDCRATRALIERIPTLLSGPITVTVEGQEMPLQDAITLIVRKIGEHEERIGALEDWRERTVDPTLADHGRRLTALEGRGDALAILRNITHLRLGGFGRLGFSTAGEATGAGGASLELLFRLGDAPVGLFLRGEFGGQETGMGVGSSMYLAGGAGLAYFTGGRRDTTISLGFFAEDLLEPFADGPNEVQGSHLGVVVGGELALSIPLPGDAYWVRIRPGFAIGYAERYFIANNAFGADSGAYFAPSIGLEFQPDL